MRNETATDRLLLWGLKAFAFTLAGWATFILLAIIYSQIVGRAYGHAIQLPNGQMYSYNGLFNIHTYQSCCGDTDCKPRQVEWRDGEAWLYFEEVETWIKAPYRSDAGRYQGGYGQFDEPLGPVIIETSPDGRYHGCFWGGSVKCIIVPATGV